jgi:hypothetical protein
MRAIANFFSFVFHPLFILTYMVLVLLWTDPYSFGWRHVAEADTLLIIIVMTSITLPATAILMMKLLGWIQDFRLETRHERIGPYIASGIMYLTLYLHVTKAETFPVSLRVVTLGSLLALWTCFFINNFIKISLHAAGVGGLVTLVALTKITFGYSQAQIGVPGGVNVVLPLDYILYFVILIAGMVCTSRMILNAHNLKEVYLGFIVGVASIALAYFILR